MTKTLRKKISDRAGFTLIEILVAVVLLAIISILVWRAMGGMTSSKERSEKRDGMHRSVAILLDRMTQELGTAVLFTSLDILGVSASAEQNLKSVFIGVNQGEQDKLTFQSLSHMRYIKDTKESDFSEITYFLEPQEGASGLFILKKREKSPPDTETGEKGRVVTLLEGVKSLSFRYYDAQKLEYSEAWDTTAPDFANRLPRAVEIRLVLQDPNDEDAEESFLTVSLLEMAPGPNDF